MRYQIDRYTPQGVRLDVIQAFNRLDFVRTENSVGTMVLEMPVYDYTFEDFNTNQQLEIWREKNGNLELMGETTYFLRDWEFYRKEQERMVRLVAQDANWLLGTRIVAYDAGNAAAEMSDYADDMMKAIVTDNLGGDAAADRQLSTLTVASDTSSSVEMDKAFSRRNVLAVLQEIAEHATEAGTNTYFDIIRTGVNTFRFMTYTGQRGTDHGRTSSDVRLVGEQYGNLLNVSIGVYHSDEYNRVFIGGQGEEDQRLVAHVRDTDRIADGYPYNYIEYFRDARNATTVAQLEDEGYSALVEGMPRWTLTGDLEDTPGMSYGIHYDFGDIVSVEAFGFAVDCHVTSVHISVDPDSYESVKVRLQGDFDMTGEVTS